MDQLDVVSSSTLSAAAAARERIATLAHGIGRDERASAQLAKAALFEDALLGALKAKFAELRMVAR